MAHLFRVEVLPVLLKLEDSFSTLYGTTEFRGHNNQFLEYPHEQLEPIESWRLFLSKESDDLDVLRPRKPEPKPTLNEQFGIMSPELTTAGG